MFDQDRLSKKEILWQALVVLAVVATAIESPYTFVFEKSIQTWQLWADAALSTIFTIDLILFSRTIKNDFGKDWTRKMSRSQQIHWAINLVCSIPFDIIGHLFGVSTGIKILRMVRLFRLLRILKIFSLVGSLTVVPNSIKLLFAAIGSAISINLIACGWIWLYPSNGEMTDFNYYVHSLYWAVTTLTTVGYGDVTPTSNAGRFYTMGIMILGVGFYGIVIGKVSQMLSEDNRYKEKSREKIQDLTLFMKHYNIPRKVQREALSYYNNLLTKRLSDNDHKIISDLPQALQDELKTYMNMKLISTLTVFKNCSHNCLKHIAQHLLHKSYSPGDRIIEHGEIGNEMYIINHGTVDVRTEDGGLIVSLDEGKFFGETALLQEAPRNANVLAATYCDLYKLSKEDFLTIIQRYPELLRNMEEVTGLGNKQQQQEAA